MALGLILSAFAETELQAVQFVPAFVLPEILLCGLRVPRDVSARADVGRQCVRQIQRRRLKIT
ncbi:MAG TPA: hypothetical protein VGF10_02870 [Gaiella sp.]|jgi:ABC-2 type transport system permease protein